MTELNNNVYEVTYISPYSFSINCDTTNFSKYDRDGFFSGVKKTDVINFTSLQDQLRSPDLLINDLSKFDLPIQNLLALQGLHKLLKQGNESFTYGKLMEAVVAVNENLPNKVDRIDERVVKSLYKTFEGQLSPLCAAVGGFVAQEIMKSVSGKFTPLKQWLLLDAIELVHKRVTEEINETYQFDVQEIKTDRYFPMRCCIDNDIIERLHKLNLFMVGCGAIGCEMLKNYSLLGIGRNQNGGCITITDNDLIEKSNLNRQFLFRPWHIQVYISLLFFSFTFRLIETNFDRNVTSQRIANNSAEKLKGLGGRELSKLH